MESFFYLLIENMKIKNSRRRVAIGLAISERPNKKILNLIHSINFFIGKLHGYELLIISCSPYIDLKLIPNHISLNDSPLLYDFSRYHSILSEAELLDSDILFAFNDTLAIGRKLNFGLYVFIFIALMSMLHRRFKKYQLWAPVDSNQSCSWVSPYFFIGNVEYLRTLNFTNWIKSKSCVSKGDRRGMVDWVNCGWRRSEVSTIRQKKIKYKTLLLERTLVSESDIKKVYINFLDLAS
jgi:hypothetical protein